jgi:hypothetical protein
MKSIPLCIAHSAGSEYESVKRIAINCHTIKPTSIAFHQSYAASYLPLLAYLLEPCQPPCTPGTNQSPPRSQPEPLGALPASSLCEYPSYP